MPTSTWWKKHRAHGRPSHDCAFCGKSFGWRAEYLGRYNLEGRFVQIHPECFIPMRNAAITDGSFA